MNFLSYLLCCWLAGIAATYATRQSQNLTRRAPMKALLGKKPSRKQFSEAKVPLLQKEHPNAHGKLTVTAPIDRSGRGVVVTKKEGNEKMESSHFGEDGTRRKRGAKPFPPGSKEHVTTSHPHKAVIDGWAAHAPTSQMQGEMTGKRVGVKMGFYGSGVGSIMKKNANGKWEEQAVHTSGEDPTTDDGYNKHTFSNPDGSPVTIKANTVGGRLKMSGKNYDKGMSPVR